MLGQCYSDHFYTSKGADLGFGRGENLGFGKEVGLGSDSILKNEKNTFILKNIYVYPELEGQLNAR